mgnify:FL=1
MERWLSLIISDKSVSKKEPSKKTVFFSVPKKAVRLATQRNRLKRLLREAARGFLPGDDRVYSFRVMRDPKSVGLESVKKAVNELISR